MAEVTYKPIVSRLSSEMKRSEVVQPAHRLPYFKPLYSLLFITNSLPTMSKFLHKVKDAMTDHDMNAARAGGSQAPHNTYETSNPPTTKNDSNQDNSSGMNTSSAMGSNNPYGSDSRSGNEPGTYRDSGMGSRGGHSDADNYGSAATGRDNSTNASQPSSSDINAGPHDSKMANKMDPRVDSDLG